MLLSELRLMSESPEKLLQDIVQPREDWLDMATIADWLPDLLDAFSKLAIPVPGDESLIEWLGSVAAERQFNEKKLSERGVKGLKTEHPQHAGLRELARRKTGGARLRITALVVAVSDQWRRELMPPDHEMYSLRLEGAWRALRLLTDIGIQQVPAISGSIRQFSATFENDNETLDGRIVVEKDIRYLIELQRFFKFFLGDGRIQNRHRRPPNDDQEWPLAGDWQMLETDSEAEVDQSNRARIHITLPAEVRSTEHFLEGNAPEELAHDSVLLDTGELAKPEFGERTGSLIRKGQPQRAAYRRMNALLPGRWGSPNEYELKCLLSERWEISSDRLFLYLLLLTGRPSEEVLATRVVKTRDQLPKEIQNPNNLYVILDERSWVGGTLKPENRRKIKREWRRYFDNSSKQLTLRIPEQFWQVIQAPLRHAARRVTSNSAAVFSRSDSPDTIADRIKRRLKDLNRSTGSQLTIKRIQNLLFDSLIRRSTDLVEASLITGKHPPFGQSAAVYYHTRAADQLAEYYGQVVAIWANVLAPMTGPDQLAFSNLSLSRVGSPFSIRADVMQTVVAGLQEQLNEYRKVIHQPSHLWRFHNLYTAYVNLMLLWATGYRAVRDPIADPTELNRRRGFLVISDKEGDGMGHSRVVYLSDRMIQQLNCYEAHRLALSQRLQMVGRETNLNTFFWYLTNDYEFIRATPKKLTSEISWIFPWPLNVSRHTLRGYLRDHDIPGDLVDVFMGHWGIGTEPWARHSALDPYAFKDAIEPVISKFLESLGFNVLRGING